jgi:ligand-binding sensor domain-containing protein
MGSNRLKMNPDKTQLIWIGTRQQLAKIDISSLTLLSAAVPLSSTVTDLGVRIDSQLTMSDHVAALRRSCFFSTAPTPSNQIFDYGQRSKGTGTRICQEPHRLL